MERLSVQRCLAVFVLSILVGRASAQSIMTALDGSSWPVTTGALARSAELVGLSFAPDHVWRCHGAYIERILDSEEAARQAVADLEVDGTRFERPDEVKKGIAIVRR